MTIAASKAELRQSMRLVRRAMDAERRSELSELICQRIIALLRGLQAGNVAIYLTRGDEPAVDAVAGDLLGRGIAVAAPCGPCLNPRFMFINDMQDIASRRNSPQRQMSADRLVAPEECDVVLVPGLAFDPDGGRLGQGGGWYDRILPRVRCSIGICFEEQIVPRVPREPHDVSMHAVVTETAIRPAGFRAGGQKS